MSIKDSIMNCRSSLQSQYITYRYILAACIDCVAENHSSNKVNDVNSYQAMILKRVCRSLVTLENVLCKCNDPVSGYGLLRIIADGVCSFCFIYDNSDADEVLFRHYLYILDGCSQFNDFYNQMISCSQLDNGKKNEINSRDQGHDNKNTEIIQEGVLEEIKQHFYYKNNKKQIEPIIKSRNWKYKSLLLPEADNRYEWIDIYEKVIGDRSISILLSRYLSQYVHGLFLSNNNNPNADSHYLIIYNMAISIEKLLLKSILNIFSKERLLERMFNKFDIKAFESGKRINLDDIINCLKPFN